MYIFSSPSYIQKYITYSKVLLYNVSFCHPLLLVPFSHNMCPNILTLNQTFDHRRSIILTRPCLDLLFVVPIQYEVCKKLHPMTIL